MGYFKDLKQSFNFAHYTFNKPWHSFWFLSKTVILAVVLMFLLLLPQTLTFADQAATKLKQFSVATVDGEFELAEPILLPSKGPWLVVDLQNERKPGVEEIRITGEDVFVLDKSVSIDELMDLKANAVAVGEVFAPLAIIILLGVAVAAGIVFWVKYVVVAVILALLAWEILDLTHLRQPFGVVFSTSMHAAAVMVLLELVITPFGHNMLIPIFTWWRLSVYAIPLLVFLIVFSLAIGLRIKQGVKN
ncbi:hypothetical protein CMO91_04370 [Candidatus Woesearchaeota archaeon]|nr:hypothetical protein [Candidatus Woesearchaeota archaeon]